MTRSTSDYADQILEKSKLNKFITDRKYRSDCEEYECKNIEMFGLFKSNTVLIDNDISNKCEGQNFYHIPMYTWQKSNDIEMIKVLFDILGKIIFG